MTSMWGAPLRSRWRGSRRRDSEQARFLTVASLKWVIANKAYTPWYLVRYYRLAKFKLANPHIITRGMVFLGKNVEIHSTPGLSRMEIGKWVHIGDGNALRCHEGSLRIGDKVVFGKDNVVNPTSTSRSARPPSSPTGATSATSTTAWTTSTCRSRTRASSRDRCGSDPTPGSPPR